jgi:hypothetical protein
MICNWCEGEVYYDPTLPAYHDSVFGVCDDPDCGAMGRYVHVGEDCRRLMWAIEAKTVDA